MKGPYPPKLNLTDTGLEHGPARWPLYTCSPALTPQGHHLSRGQRPQAQVGLETQAESELEKGYRVQWDRGRGAPHGSCQWSPPCPPPNPWLGADLQAGARCTSWGKRPGPSSLTEPRDLLAVPTSTACLSPALPSVPPTPLLGIPGDHTGAALKSISLGETTPPPPHCI